MRLAQPLILTLWLACAGCAAPFLRYRFGPKPLETVVQNPAAEAPMARVLITILGIRENEPGLPEVQVRLRVENRGSVPLTLATDELLLVDQNLVAFGEARIDAGHASADLAVRPRNDRTFELSFPFPLDQPVEELALDGLNLKWGLAHASGSEVYSSTFERIIPDAYPWSYSSFHSPFYFSYRCD